MSNHFTYPSSISGVTFHILGPDDVKQQSHVNVTSKELFKMNKPIAGGIYDRHMGTTDSTWFCGTCNNSRNTCPGHFGSIRLKYPVKNPLFREILHRLLKIICFKCYRPIINKKLNVAKHELFGEYSKPSRIKKQSSNKTTTSEGKISERQAKIKKVNEKYNCIHCGAPHPEVIQHASEPNVFMIERDRKTSMRESKNKTVSDRYEFLNHEIKIILDNITDADVEFIGLPLTSHPRKFILSEIAVPPNSIRPDARDITGTRSGNSDITSILKAIVEKNDTLPDVIPPREQIGKRITDLNLLDLLYTNLIKESNGNKTVKVVTSSNKQPSSIAGRLSGKHGRLRGDMMGKRCRYMIRSAITGDTSMRVDQIGIPVSMAKIITIPEVVNDVDRLNMYYRNGDKYPGCSSITKVTGGTFNIKFIDKSYKLQIGDIVHRHMIDGDIVNFNRPPSLLYSNISGQYVKIMFDAETIRMNVSACVLYNADFDGDCMHCLVPCDIMSRVELMKLSHVSNWFVSYKHSLPVMGGTQDVIIGSAELSRGFFDIGKWQAMSIFSRIDCKNIEFTKMIYTNKEVFSKIFPQINMGPQKPAFFMSEYASSLGYKPDDAVVEIKQGKLIRGMLDKNSIGEQIPGTIFHIVANKFGAQRALDLVYDFHQITSRFLLYRGFTCGISDIWVNDDVKNTIKINRAKLRAKYKSITDQLVNGTLTPPIGMGLKDYYEDLILNALQTGSDYVEPIFRSIDVNNNGIVKLILTGSKGKIGNLVYLSADIGQPTISGHRPGQQLALGRTSPYFFRFDPSPESRGYISTSYSEGIKPEVYATTAGEARHSLITNALSTSISGFQGRLCAKSFESIIISNKRASEKANAIVQPIYAESGWDPRRVEKVKFPSILISDKKFGNMYELKVKNPKIAAALKEEFQIILADRIEFRRIFMELDSTGPAQGKTLLMKDKYIMPFNVQRIIRDIVRDYADIYDGKLDVISAIKLVVDFCKELPYLYFNDKWYRNRKPIPPHINAAVFMVQIYLRSTLASAVLIKKGVNNKMLEITIDMLRAKFSRALIDYGCAIGIIASQCISEPLVQYMLDSKHRAGGGGGSKTNTIDRYREISEAKNTDRMANPSMTLMVRSEFRDDEEEVQRIANHIEMMHIRRFVKGGDNVAIFCEKFGKPVHPQYKHEEKMIAYYMKHANADSSTPIGVSIWCIRFEMNRKEMLINHMQLESIIDAINADNDIDVFVVHSPENAKNIVIRCYPMKSAIRPTRHKSEKVCVINIMNNILDILIRGVEGIKNARVIRVIVPEIRADGSVDSTSLKYGIETDGTNLEDIITDPYIDPMMSQCDSILEFYDMFGVEATREKLIGELLKNMGGLSRNHLSILADEMTYTGRVTNIQNKGVSMREGSNVLLRMSMQAPVAITVDAALHGVTTRVSGISAPLVVGGDIQVGTLYNDVIMDEEFLKQSSVDALDALDDIL